MKTPPLNHPPQRGHWHRTDLGRIAPEQTTMSFAFSGWTDVDTALRQSAAIKDQLVGDQYICLGGGESNSAFNLCCVQAVTSAIRAGKFSGYDGIAYIIEEGCEGLGPAFAASFAEAKRHQLKVVVAVSLSAPFGIEDAPELMQSFFANDNIDMISPQLYVLDNAHCNDFSLRHGVTWQQYAHCKAAIVPRIVHPELYQCAQRFLAAKGVTVQGYIASAPQPVASHNGEVIPIAIST